MVFFVRERGGIVVKVGRLSSASLVLHLSEFSPAGDARGLQPASVPLPPQVPSAEGCSSRFLRGFHLGFAVRPHRLRAAARGTFPESLLGLQPVNAPCAQQVLGRGLQQEASPRALGSACSPLSEMVPFSAQVLGFSARAVGGGWSSWSTLRPGGMRGRSVW
jgi:hypothetical protein